jgi:hypothetical protein
MKRVLIILLGVMSTSMVWGQTEKEKVAIYTTDNSGQNIVEFVGDFLTNAIVKRGTYVAIERTAQFLQELNKEQTFQRTGAVDDSQISRLGKNMGVQLVCVVKIGKSGEQLFISARLIDVETATLKSSARPVRFDADDWDGIEKACENITASMFGERGSGATSRTSSGSGNRVNGSSYNPDGIEMIYVEGQGSGVLAMKGFYIGKYEVTQSQWQAVMGNNPSSFKGGNNPVENVSWNDVQEFIKKLNAMTGRSYRLPTEAEWEYAAREGKNNSSYEYSGSNSLGSVAWYADNSGSQTHPVGQKSPNALGIYDMSGNVWEWCQDCYDSSCSNRVNRGGSWGNSAAYCRVANRSNNSPDFRSYSLGFRLVLLE